MRASIREVRLAAWGISSSLLTILIVRIVPDNSKQGVKLGMPSPRRYTTFMLPAALKQRVTALLGPQGCLDRPADLSLYEYDGGVDKHPPVFVIFTRTTENVAALVKLACEFDFPFVGRGAGTGL